MPCKFCGTHGKQKLTKIVKGFCQQHYQWYRRGYLSENGTLLKRPRVFVKDKTNLKCKVIDCDKNAEISVYCYTHHSSYCQGYLNEEGTQRRSPNYSRDGVCIIKGCSEKRHQRGRCKTHYKEYMRNPDKDKRNHTYVNEGDCPIAGCKHKKFAAGLCRTHYQHLMKGKFENNYKPDEYIGPNIKAPELKTHYCLNCNQPFATTNPYNRLCHYCLQIY